MRGIVLAGGAGTRLYPASLPISKILLPIYDKPMVYYPISVLLNAGIKDILIITNPQDNDNFVKLLGDGSKFGVRFEYKIQEVQRGIADAFILGEDFIGEDEVALILGDNIFYGPNFASLLKEVTKRKNGETVFGYRVNDPERFGVVEFNNSGKAVSLEEKPQKPKSNYAVTGLYFYDKNVCKYAKTLKPSARGELEITDLNKIYLENGNLHVEVLGQDFDWLDTGTHDTLLEASNFVQAKQNSTKKQIACLEEIAFEQGFISAEELSKNLEQFKGKNAYYDYILKRING